MGLGQIAGLEVGSNTVSSSIGTFSAVASEHQGMRLYRGGRAVGTAKAETARFGYRNDRPAGITLRSRWVTTVDAYCVWLSGPLAYGAHGGTESSNETVAAPLVSSNTW